MSKKATNGYKKSKDTDRRKKANNGCSALKDIGKNRKANNGCRALKDIGKSRKASNGSWTSKEAECRERESNDESKKIVTDGDKKIGHAKIGIKERIARIGIGDVQWWRL